MSIMRSLARLLRMGEKRNLPVNRSGICVTPEILDRDVDYIIKIARFYLNMLPDDPEFLKGRAVLEIGPGINLGVSLILACRGADMMVVDRFLVEFQDHYHFPLYERLKVKLAVEMPDLDLSPVDLCLQNRCHVPEALRSFRTPLEDLRGLPENSVDVVFSNAVFEHFYSPARAFKALARVCRIDGLGFHQVDFRDHRDFSKPLEYLLPGKKDFRLLFESRHGECGNRLRPHETHPLLEQAGFEIIRFEPNIFAEADYLAEFMPRLRTAADSPYRESGQECLSTLSGRYSVRRR
jgi:SAM-dependent methyltransferase